MGAGRGLSGDVSVVLVAGTTVDGTLAELVNYNQKYTSPISIKLTNVYRTSQKQILTSQPNSILQVKKGKGHTLDTALPSEQTSLHKCSGEAHNDERLPVEIYLQTHTFIKQIKRTIPASAFPAEAGPRLPTPGPRHHHGE